MIHSVSRHFEGKMSHPLIFIGINLCLAILILGAAELGQLLGLKGQALAVSVVWPATGIALAALLLFGYRTWPGIFLGNFAYNALNLYLNLISTIPGFTLGIFLVAFIISLGSLAQALMSAYIMRRYTTELYFYTVKDIFIFLIPATLMASVIASTIGVATLYFYKAVSGEMIPYLWAVFWLGDTMGVYIFTPLLVVWALQKPTLFFSKYGLEILIISITFIILSIFTFYLKYPLAHLFLPLSLWAAYRFRMPGATLAIFIISLPVITLHAFGYGFDDEIKIPVLGLLVSFLEVIVAASLLLAAVINEREDAWLLVQSQNKDLQQTVEMREEAIKEMQRALFIKKKLTDSLVLLTSGITSQLKEPLKHVDDFTKASNVCLSHLKELAQSKRGRIDQQSVNLMQENLKTLDGYLHNIKKFEDYSSHVLKAILEQSELISPSKIEVRPVNLNTLLETCLAEAATKAKIEYPEFNFLKKTDLSSSVDVVLALPESLTYAFTRLMEHAIHSLKIKKDKLRASFLPELELCTVNRVDNIEIVIKDNAALPVQQHFLGSFVDWEMNADTPKLTPTLALQSEEISSSLDLALAHDIIVHVHHGKIMMNFKEDESLEVKILFPKHYLETR